VLGGGCDREPDGLAAEVADKVQAPVEGCDVGGDDLEGADFAVFDLRDARDADAHGGGGDLFLSYTQLPAGLCQLVARVRASNSRASASISLRVTPALCSSRSGSSRSSGVRSGVASAPPLMRFRPLGSCPGTRTRTGRRPPGQTRHHDEGCSCQPGRRPQLTGYCEPKVANEARIQLPVAQCCGQIPL
jgi:hypothetical protein